MRELNDRDLEQMTGGKSLLPYIHFGGRRRTASAPRHSGGFSAGFAGVGRSSAQMAAARPASGGGGCSGGSCAGGVCKP